MDDEEALFEQIILSDFKMQISTVLKTFNNYSIIMTNNNDNMRHEDISKI